MNVELSFLIIALAPILATLLVWAVAALCLRNYLQRRTSAAIGAADCPRSPGQSICQTIAGYDIQCRIHTIYLVSLPLVLCAVYGITYLAGPATGSLWEIFWIISNIAFLVLICLLRLIRSVRLRRRARLAYQGKQLSARALEPLLDQGHLIFHDFIIDQIHIDHLIIGPKGVFCIQTQTPPATLSGSRHAVSTVTYNGRALFFPKGEDYLPIAQANRHAEWISAWLSQSLEEPIAARAILAMPGWVVKRTSADGIPVVNPNQFASLFKHINARPLSETAIRNMASRVEGHYLAVPLADAEQGSETSD